MAAIAWKKIADGDDIVGRRRAAYWQMVLSGTTYTAGGMVVSGATFGLKSILAMLVASIDVLPSSTSSYWYFYNSTTGGVQIFGGAASGVAGAEVSGSLTVSTTFLVISGSD